MLKVLFVGDIVGPEAARWVAARVPTLREQYELDWVVVNGENCAVTGPNPMDGFGLTLKIADELLASGVDAITGGNHSWDGPDADRVLSYPEVVRPVNVDERLGQGAVTLKSRSHALTVVNLLSPTAALPGMRAPQPHPIWPSWEQLRAGEALPGSVIIDLHGESAWEKASFATAVDGQVAAVLGTHTHDPTLRGHVLPGGTGYVTEVGMTGRLGFTGGGFDPAHFAASLRGEDITALPAYELADGSMALGAVVVTLDNDGTTRTIERIE
ncbi:MAG: YmdB family metallophosphoesterase [Actinomycetota bacterium]|nr:YmdB family metallophosphoesterase [Actinomycetota bacterium]